MSENDSTSESPLAKVYERSIQDPEFRKRLLSEPRKVLEEEMGLMLPENLNINVIENTRSEYTIVLPVAEEISDEDLDAISAAAYVYHIPEHNVHTASFNIKGATTKDQLGFGNNPHP